MGCCLCCFCCCRSGDPIIDLIEKIEFIVNSQPNDKGLLAGIISAILYIKASNEEGKINSYTVNQIIKQVITSRDCKFTTLNPEKIPEYIDTIIETLGFVYDGGSIPQLSKTVINKKMNLITTNKNVDIIRFIRLVGYLAYEYSTNRRERLCCANETMSEAAADQLSSHLSKKQIDENILWIGIDGYETIFRLVFNYGQ